MSSLADLAMAGTTPTSCGLVILLQLLHQHIPCQLVRAVS